MKEKVENGIMIRDEQIYSFSRTVSFRLRWCADSSAPVGGGFVSGVTFVNLLFSILRFKLNIST